MDDTQSIVAVIRDTPYLNKLLVLGLTEQEQKGFLSVRGLFSAMDHTHAAMLEPSYKEMYDICRSIEVVELLKRFSKEKLSADEFFSIKNQQVVKNVVFPFVWKQTVKLIQIIDKLGVAIYDARYAWPNLYEEDRVFQSGISAELNLVFKRTPEGTQYNLHVKHNDRVLDLHKKGTEILTEYPCLLLHDKKLLQFDDHVSGKLIMPFLSKNAIHIPKHIEHEYFNGFVKKNVNRLSITAEGFEIIDLDLHPRAFLSIEMDWQGYYGFLLSFEYGNRRIPVNSQSHNFTTLEIEVGNFIFKRFVRKMPVEKHACDLLAETGLSQYGAFFRLSQGCVEKLIFMRFVYKHYNHFIERGFIIEQPERDQYLFGKPEIVLKDYDHTDWFDLRIEIKVDHVLIPFTALKDHILNGKSVYVLPSGERFLIPEEWFERYNGLFVHGKADCERLKIDKRHFRMLEAFRIPSVKKMEEELLSDYTPEKPKLLDVNLRPYQMIGFAWMQKLSRQMLGGILADDMGLGKTLQVIALLSSYFSKNCEVAALEEEEQKNTIPAGFQLSLFDAESSQTEGVIEQAILNQRPAFSGSNNPALLIVPTSILHNWISEIHRYAPWLRVFQYWGHGRSFNSRVFKDHHIVLTTYGILRADVELLKSFFFSHIILDESHSVKNPFSKVSRAAFALQASHRFALTGTPVENSLADIWSQMHFVNPGMLGSLSDFKRNYASMIEKDPETLAGRQLMELISPYIMRRTKDRVASELPPITESTILCSMSSVQSELYEREKSRLRNLILEDLSGRTENQSKHLLLLKALMKLRQLANHPRMAYKGSNADSGKFEAVTSKLETLVAEKHKVLVFSSFVKHLEIMEAWCISKGVDYTKLIGSTTKREAVINKFKKNPVPVFLISLKAGGVGLNLPEAGYVFLLDPWWNPAAEMQAINRTHRIGQDKNVIVYRFVSKDTVEEKILWLQKKKRILAETVVKAGEYVKNLTAKEIETLLQ